MDGIIDRLEIIRDDKSAADLARPRVVIIGAGFGGLSTAMRLAHVAADVTVIDRRNHHLFQPLLYQVATAALSPADIAADRPPKPAPMITTRGRAEPAADLSSRIISKRSIMPPIVFCLLRMLGSRRLAR